MTSILHNADDPRTLEVVRDVTDILNKGLASLDFDQMCDVLCIVAAMVSNYADGIVAEVEAEQAEQVMQ